MERNQALEEFKIECLTKVQNRDDIPQDVINVLKREFNEIFTIYNRYVKENDAKTILEYMQGKFNELKTEVRSIGELRKSDEIEQTSTIIRYLQKDETGDKMINVDEIKLKNIQNTKQIAECTIDSLKNIRNQHNRILEDRGYSKLQIEMINEKINQKIYEVSSRKSEDIYDIFQNDEQMLKDEIESEYNQFEDKQKIEQNKREEFKRELDAGKSLKEQQEYVQNVLNREDTKSSKENEEKEEKEEPLDLPDDILI